MTGPDYFNTARGMRQKVSDRTFLPSAGDRPVETVRPLTIGAARLTTRFECLAPWDWTGAIVLAQLFKLYDMEACGWDEHKTGVAMIGSRQNARRWMVTKQ